MKCYNTERLVLGHVLAYSLENQLTRNSQLAPSPFNISSTKIFWKLAFILVHVHAQNNRALFTALDLYLQGVGHLSGPKSSSSDISEDSLESNEDILRHGLSDEVSLVSRLSDEL